MRAMPLTDAFFLLGESREAPMHVGGLNLFTLPKDVDDTTFLQNLASLLRWDGELRRPFGEKLKTGLLGLAGNIFWEEDDDLDWDYHIRHSALPRPGRYRELFALVSRLHGTLLERSRPLWEIHLIEGLQNRQFATYFKAHHCAIDGVGSMHLMRSMYSTNARTRVKISPFSYEAYKAYRSRLESEREGKPGKQRETPTESEARALLDVLREQVQGPVNVGRALREAAQVWMGRNTELAVPFHQVPQCTLAARINGSRRFVAQSWPFERVRAVGKAFGGTLNDATLAMVSGALRKYLQELRDLPKVSLKAMAPVSLRAAGDVDSANAVGMVIADLATNVRDPARRIRAIKTSMDSAKGQLQQMSPTEIQIYTGITQAPLLVTQLTGLAGRFPAFSTVVSNVPGPREQLYWNGARLDGMYPVSIPFDGAAVNFTLVSNFENLDFGIVACRKSVPHVQRLIDYMEDALVELEDAAGIRRSRQPARGRKRTAKRAITAASDTPPPARTEKTAAATPKKAALTPKKAASKAGAGTKAKPRLKAKRGSGTRPKRAGSGRS